MVEGNHRLQPELLLDALDFVAESFKDPLQRPERWHHADLYNNFEVWGYKVKSNKDAPGYIDLTNVTRDGFGISTRKWLPLGDPIENVELDITTDSIYDKEEEYYLLDYKKSGGTTEVNKIKSDNHGRINVNTDHLEHVFGIYREGGPAALTVVDYKIDNGTLFLSHHQQSKLRLKILNRGGSEAQNIKVSLETDHPDVKILKPMVDFERLGSAKSEWMDAGFQIVASNAPVSDGSPFRVRFNVKIEDENGSSWMDELDIPVFYNVPEFENIGIDDGDSEIFGSGNGNNIAEPGERIMIYEVNHRTRLYYDDPCIESESVHVDLQPDKWGDGYAVSSLLRISEGCPVGHEIRFLANYEIKEWKTIKRNVYWGSFTITVGEDQ